MKHSNYKTTTTVAKAMLGIALLALVWASCTSKASDTQHTAAAANKAPEVPVEGYVLNAQTLNEEMDIAGTLMAKQEVTIMSELSRKVVAVHVQEGKHVAKGALLFKLDDSDLRAQLEQLHQQEKLAKLNEQRLKDLIDHQAVMQQDYDQSFTNLMVLQAQIKQLKVNIEKTSIRAPFNGRIGIVNVYTGAYVALGNALATISDNEQVKLDFAVPEKYSNTLKVGDQVKFTVESNQKQYPAKIVAMGAKLDNDTRSLMVRALANNPSQELLAGQSARLKISLNTSAHALMIPNQALIPSSQGYSVFVVKGKKAISTNIKVGERNAFSVNVLEGLHAGDTIVSSNMLRITPAAEIKLVSIH